MDELLANYNLEIMYHHGKVNQVAYALSRRQTDVSEKKEAQVLVRALADLRLNAITIEGETSGHEILNQADLLWNIRRAH